MTGFAPELHDVAEGAILVEYPGLADEEANLRAVALGRALLASGSEALRDAIPGARTLLLVFDPAGDLRGQLRRRVASPSHERAVPPAGRALSVAACYERELAPDLEDLASGAGLTAEEAARRHAAGQYTVAFLGFAPGFAYLTGLDPALHARRLATPRPRVPPGSVAIGGSYTGIYPAATPGGWRLIGRSAVRLFDEEAESPATLQPGDRVRFERVGRAELEALERQVAAAAARSDTSPGGRPVLRVVRPGLFTSVQGGPRWRHGATGLPPGGAMDEPALHRVNARLGNPASAPALEITLLGPELEAQADAAICLSGARISAERNGAPLPFDSPVRLSAGDRLRFGPAPGAMRAYLGVEGGFQAPGRHGLTRRLEAGEILMAAPGAARRRDAEGLPAAARDKRDADGPLTLRVLLDPRRDRFFEARAIEEFLSSPCRVSSTSDRRGIRLEGATLAARGGSEMPPEGTPLGAIQVPADGHPIVLGPDRPITGGYARLGTVIAADWPEIAQAPPGRAVRFAPVALSEAFEAGVSI